MEVCREPRELKGKLRNTAVTLGNFDGVHLGHRNIFEHLLKRAAGVGGDALVFTFDPHPVRVLRPELSPNIITPVPEKLKLMEACGIKTVILADFTKEFAALHPLVFVEEILVGTLNAKLVVVGHDFSFGKGKEGTIDSLIDFGEKLGFEVDVVKAFKVNGEVVSSTGIRRLIHSGKMEEAAQFLGRYYSIEGKVVKGDSRGKRLGFPTANLDYRGELLPGNGVYAVRITIDDNEMQGIANIGVKPTFGERERNIEVHIFNFDEHIYEKTLRITFLDRIREEISFSGPEELTQQIIKDIVIAKNMLSIKKN